MQVQNPLSGGKGDYTLLKPKISMSQLIMLLTLSRMFYSLNGILLGTGDGFGMAYLLSLIHI